MLSIKKILLPVDFPNPSLPVIHQAATLARQFHSEIVMLHVVTPASHAAGVPKTGPQFAGWDIVGEIIRYANQKQDTSLQQELYGITTRRILTRGDAAKAIVSAAKMEEADLIMMASYGEAFNRFLLGSVTAKVLHGTECPVWTGAHVERSALEKYAIRNVLCAVDFAPHSRTTVSLAMQIAAEFGARLTLAHVTASVEFWGPGGFSVNPKWKAALIEYAAEQLALLQREMSTKAETFIGSGDVPKVLREAVEQTKADLLVIGCRPYEGHLRTSGYAIICAAPAPVLSV